MPSSSLDVAIVGGGIIGIATAYALVDQGLRVAVFEKGGIGGEQSTLNWGWIRTLLRDPSEVPLALKSLPLWRSLQSKIDVGYRQSGIMYLARNRRDLEEYQNWLRKVPGVGANILSDGEVMKMLPCSKVNWHGGIYNSSDAVAEPSLATTSIATLAREHGCIIHEGCAARSVGFKSGRVDSIHTEIGTFRTNAVLVAAGAWSRLFCGNLGIDLPQLKVRASALKVSAPEAKFGLTVNGRDFTCRRCADDTYLISQFNSSYADIVPDSFLLFNRYISSWIANKSLVKLRLGRRFIREWNQDKRFDHGKITPFEQERQLVAPPPPHAKMASVVARVAAAFEGFENASIVRSWSGYIDVMPDALPVISTVEGYSGLYVATGFSGHGFGIAPAVGSLMADVIAGGTHNELLHPFSLARFR